MMYTIQYTKNQVHEFVHDFMATFWHFVVFSNITNKVEMLANKVFWYFVASCGMMGFRAIISCICENANIGNNTNNNIIIILLFIFLLF